MPENYVAGELDFCSQEFSYDTYDIKLVALKDCIVNKRGFIYEQSKFKMNKISLLDEKHYTDFFSVRHYLKKVLFKSKRTLSKQKYLLSFDDWSGDHYHWFCDTLTRLFAIQDKVKDYILLLPDSPYIRDVGLKSLDFFGLKPASIEFIKDTELVSIPNLSIVTHTCLTGYINDKIMHDMKAYISSKINYNLIPEKKLYITRDKARYRKILNETAVQNIVKDFGYEITRFEDLSWHEQIAQAASASSIVSIHGAGLVNMMFMRPEGSILEFRRTKIYHNQCFWHLSKALQLKYYYLFGIPDNDNLVIEGNGCNLTVNEDLLIQTLSKM